MLITLFFILLETSGKNFHVAKAAKHVATKVLKLIHSTICYDKLLQY